MKIRHLFLTAPLAMLAACGGGDAPAKPSAPSVDANATKAPPASEDAGDAGAGADSAPEQQPQKRTRRPRVDFRMVKALLGNETPAPKAPVEATPALVALGETLYHDPAFSADGSASCASCHDLANYGVDGKKATGGRNAPTTYNAHRQFAQSWDGRHQTIEEQIREHGLLDAAGIVAKIAANDELAAAFQEAFPGQDDPASAENFGVAIGAFARTLVTRSKWDDFVEGNQRALDNEALAGLQAFMQVGCTQCHMNRTLGGQMFQKLGLIQAVGGEDTGRMQVTGAEADKYMFKVPGLLNVAKTAPYYHDGSIATLEEAVVHMAKVQLGRELTDEQTKAIVAFLEALTGPLPEKFAKKG